MGITLYQRLLTIRTYTLALCNSVELTTRTPRQSAYSIKKLIFEHKIATPFLSQYDEFPW